MDLTLNIRIGLPAMLLLLFSACNHSEPESTIEGSVLPSINLKHFQYLYQEVELANQAAAIVNIYSEYPDYSFAIEPSEGFTCVDDVARAIVLLSEYHQKINQEDSIELQVKKMIEFVLFMQNENGYFNNFIWHDLSINTTYPTTVAELNWWSLRALWALETAFPLISDDQELRMRMSVSIDRLLQNIKRDLPLNERATEQAEGLTVPTWLPQKYAGDQAAILSLGLLANYERTHDSTLKPMIEALAEGMILLQKGTAEQFPNYAFMSWKNLWHAWGNSQSYALLKAGKILQQAEYTAAALREIDYFYPYLLENGFAEAFWIQKDGTQIIESKRNSFPQIAYGIRPMVWAALEAYQITKEDKYQDLAHDLAAWLSGDNVVQTKMYQEETGRCFDGIISKTDINRNSGAESTIESLLTLVRLHSAQ